MIHALLERLVMLYRAAFPIEAQQVLALPAEVGVSLANEIVQAAVSQIGLGERGRNNEGMYVERYAAAVDRNAPIYWCAAFVFYCYLRACTELGAVAVVKPSASAKSLCRNILAAGGVKLTEAQCQPGDIVLWHRGAKGAYTGHVGIVQSVNRSTGTFTVLEGNRGGFPSNVGVFTHTFGEANLLGFYRLPQHKLLNQEVIA